MYESDSQTDNATNDSDESALVERVINLLAGGRAGVITDIDGTISPIVAIPENARVLPKARDALQGLKSVLSLVGVVSGRTADDAQAMVGIDGLTYVGNHGLEVRTPDAPTELVAEARPWVPRLSAVLDEVRHQLDERGTPAAQSGILMENKGATASLHYRLAADPERTRRELLEILARAAITSGLRVEEGRMVINLLPPLTVTKGSAVSWLVRQHRLTRVIYFGDDVTDAHAFRALAVLRQSGEVRTLAIGVVGNETPASIRQLADATVPSVASVADLLSQVLEGLRSSASMGPKDTRESLKLGESRMAKDVRTIEQGKEGSAGELAGMRVAILAETLYEDLELWYPFYRLREAGADVFVVGSGSAETYQSKHGYPVSVDAEADTVTASQFDAVIIPGGYSPDHMRRHPGMVKLVREAHEQGKVVGAICHAGWMLASANIVRGRTATSFRSIKDDMVNAGASWVDREVVRDGNLVTSRMPADLPAFMRTIITALKERRGTRSTERQVALAG